MHDLDNPFMPPHVQEDLLSSTRDQRGAREVLMHGHAMTFATGVLLSLPAGAIGIGIVLVVFGSVSSIVYV